MSDQELYASRKRTAPVEDVRFLLRVCGHRMTDEERASFTDLIEAGPKGRSAFYAEYYRRKEAWRARVAPRREAADFRAAGFCQWVTEGEDGRPMECTGGGYAPDYRDDEEDEIDEMDDEAIEELEG